jgi:outer membrane immunogenic protein
MKFSKFIVLSATIATGALMGIGRASAADLPVRTYSKAPAVVAALAMSGDVALGVFGFPQTGGISPSGGLIGGTVGCNYQVNNFVFGIEGITAAAPI